MKTTKTRLRGICQCCGRDQAVLASGTMSKHGYTVEHGWFNGVCSGQRYEPLQKSRVQADLIVSQVRKEAAALRVRAEDLRTGKIDPETCATYRRDEKGRTIHVPYAEGTAGHQQAARKEAVWKADQRASMGESFANDLEDLANRIHGTELRAVPVDAGPAPILFGERRRGANKRVLIVTGVVGARVHWKDDAGFKGWTGTRAWRNLPIAD